MPEKFFWVCLGEVEISELPEDPKKEPSGLCGARAVYSRLARRTLVHQVSYALRALVLYVSLASLLQVLKDIKKIWKFAKKTFFLTFLQYIHTPVSRSYTYIYESIESIWNCLFFLFNCGSPYPHLHFKFRDYAFRIKYYACDNQKDSIQYHEDLTIYNELNLKT